MTANDKSSGNPASSGLPHQASSPGTFSDDVRNGVNNFMLMLSKVLEIGEGTVGRLGDGDGRDYKAIAHEIETAIYANLLGGSKGAREGFLRAFTDYVAIHEDGFGLPVCWDPLSSTASAFAREGEGA